MLLKLTIVACATALLSVAGAAGVSAQPEPGESQSSTMAPPSGNRDGANNGIGTSGSLDHNDGTASSTVNGANSPVARGAQGSNRGAGGAIENDPALGGGKQ